MQQATSPLRAAKRAARLQARQRLQALPAACFGPMGAAMAQALLASPLWAGARSVFCFVSTGPEPDTRPILQAALDQGKTLAVPRILGPGQMEAALLPSLDLLEPGAYDIPAPGPAQPALPPRQLELALLPCLAATAGGGRLGHGGGFYDRFLQQFPGRTVLLCPQALLFEQLPMGPQDVWAQQVLTEQGFCPPR